MSNNLGQDLGRLFEVGFNIGMLAYIQQNQITHHFGNLYRQDLQNLSFNKILKRLTDREKVVSEQHRQIVAKWSTFFVQKGFLSGLNFLSEYLKATGWNERQLNKLEILYYQCCFADDNSIGTYVKGREQGFRDVLSQFGNVDDIAKYAGKGEFLNADTLILLQCGKQLRVICVDLSVFSIKSIRDLVDVSSVDVLKNLLLKEISYLKSKSVFANLGIDTKNSGINLSSELRHYFTAFKREDKESVKLIQAASYAHSFHQFLRSHLSIDDSIIFNVVGYSDRSISAMSVNKDNFQVLETCSQIYKQECTNQEITEARRQVLNLIKRNAARSFQNGREFIKELLEFGEDGVTQIFHQERIEGFCNSIDIVPTDLAQYLQVKQSTFRDAHAELITKTLVSDTTYLFLTGNPGIGKTTAIANFLRERNPEEGFLFFYVSPRKQVNLDIIKKFTLENKLLYNDNLFTINTNSDLIDKNAGRCTVQYLSNKYQETFIEQTVHFINQNSEIDFPELHSKSVKRTTEDRIQNSVYKSRGVLNTVCQAIYTIINREISNHIVATVSIQSLKKTQNGKDTLHHFEQIFKDAYNTKEGCVIPSKMKQLSRRIKHLFIMIDEITGDDSGVEFLNGISRILQNYNLTEREYGFNVKIIVADASIVDLNIIKQHLTETSTEPNKIFFKKAPASIHPLSLQSFRFSNSQAVVINANSYPAKSLNIKYKVFIESLPFNSELLKRTANLQSCIQKQIIEDINYYLEQPTFGQVIVYIQDKSRLTNIIEKIKLLRTNFQYLQDYLEIHANLSEQEKQDIHLYKDNVKIIFMTASASRGLSFPKTMHILIDIPRFEIERNLMEIIQVIYRGRGDKILDSQDKELIFYLSEQAIYYNSDRQISLEESVLNLLNILLILKTSIMTRINGYGQIGRENFMMIPIGGKSVFAAGETFSGKMSTLIKQLKKEHERRRNDQLLINVYMTLKQLFSQADIILRDINLGTKAHSSYLQKRKSLTTDFLKLININFAGLLDFAPIQTAYISGSLLVVPILDATVEEIYKLKLGDEIINYEDGKLLKKMYVIKNSSHYPETLRHLMQDAIELINTLREEPHKTQYFEQNSHYLDRYYAIPLFTFISSETLSQHTNICDEPEDQRFRDILGSYISSIYPVNNVLPIGHKYKDFPFVVFRSYSLNEMRNKIFTDKYLLNSHELNVLNLILCENNTGY
jgi:hypothetical protein